LESIRTLKVFFKLIRTSKVRKMTIWSEHRFWRSGHTFDVLIFLTFDILIVLKILLMFWPFNVLIFDVPTPSLSKDKDKSCVKVKREMASRHRARFLDCFGIFLESILTENSLEFNAILFKLFVTRLDWWVKQLKFCSSNRK
jgi:hypothetical protein